MPRRALIAALRFAGILLALGSSGLLAEARGEAGPALRCDGPRRVCEPELAGAAWIEEYGSFRVYRPGSGRSAPADRAGRRSTPIPESLHLGTFEFDPLTIDPATALEERGVARAPDPGGDDYVVQFEAPIREEWLDRLRAAGLELVQYVPHHAFLVYGSQTAVAQARILPRVRAIVRYRAAHRLPAELLWAVDATPRSGVAEFGREMRSTYDLAIAKRAARAPTEAAIAAGGGRLLARLELPSSFFDLLRVELPPAAVAALATRPEVLRIDPYVPPEREDERAAQIVAGNYTNATTIAAPGYDPATQFGVDGTGVTVAIVDDGIGIPGDGGVYVTSANAVDGPLRGASPGADGHGHLNATIVAGTTPFGALDPLGYNYGRGVAPGAHLVNIPFLRIPAYTGTETDTANDAITTAGPNGQVATISNNSWGNGTNGNAYDSYAGMFDSLTLDASAAESIDPLLFVFSAGNSGTGGLTRPKVAKNVIAVAASENVRPTLTTLSGSTGAADNLEQLPDFSSRGPAADGRIKPDLTAPGAAITGGRSGPNSLFGNIDTVHRQSSGTSHAAPQVAGAAALFVAEWKGAHGGAHPSPAMIKAALLNGAVEMTGAGAASPIPNGDEGWGRVNLSNSLSAETPRVSFDQTILFDEPGDQSAASFEVARDDRPVRVTLTWSDPPALGDPALVNDLDLELIAGATVYRGNRFSGGVSIAGGTADSLNNVENVFLPAGTLISGSNFVVRVVASELDGDGALGEGDGTDQRFALVVSNAEPSSAASLLIGAPTLVAETCVPENSAIDPGEGVELSLCLKNLGEAPSGDLAVSLQASTTIDPILGTREFGALAAGQEACRTFEIAVTSSLVCGDPMPLDFEVTEEGEPRPAALFGLSSGQLVTGAPVTWTDSSQLSIPLLGEASDYPSQIVVAGATGTVVDTDLELHEFAHAHPSDVDLMLVAPDGTAAMLFSDVVMGISGASGVSGLEIVLDDQAGNGLPYDSGLVAGSFHPADFAPGDTMPAPAPVQNAPPELSSFDGRSPNGTWSLYVADDASGSSGKLQHGWSLRLVTGQIVCATDCSLIFADGFEQGDAGRWIVAPE